MLQKLAAAIVAVAGITAIMLLDEQQEAPAGKVSRFEQEEQEILAMQGWQKSDMLVGLEASLFGLPQAEPPFDPEVFEVAERNFLAELERVEEAISPRVPADGCCAKLLWLRYGSTKLEWVRGRRDYLLAAWDAAGRPEDGRTELVRAQDAVVAAAGEYRTMQQQAYRYFEECLHDSASECLTRHERATIVHAQNSYRYLKDEAAAMRKLLAP